MKKLYSKFNLVCSVRDPVVPQEKVQFNIRYYFFRRGAKNMKDLTKTTFIIKTDVNTGKRFVCKAVDELNKNHNELDRKSYTAMMPEMVGDPKCPDSSFEIYLEHPNPNCDSLWQRPRETMHLKVNDQSWYYDKCVGIDTFFFFDFLFYLGVHSDVIICSPMKLRSGM